MRSSWSAAIMAVLYITTSLVLARSTFSILHISRADTSISKSQANRRALSDTTQEGGLQPSKQAMNATDTACIDRLLELNGIAGSPTGMSVCYAVSSLDTTTAEFVSQIMLYQVSPATGNWTNIDPTSLNVNIAYPGANLTDSILSKRSQTHRLSSRTKAIQKRGNHPVLVMTESFSGKVMTGWDPTDQTKQMAALIPIVTLSALTPQPAPQQSLLSTLPATEAAFVMGSFAPQAAAAAASAAASAASLPFILPGTRRAPEISPLGPIITGLWVLLFVGTVGAGTLQRWKFRMAYRRKVRFNAWQGAKGGNLVPRAVVGYERY